MHSYKEILISSLAGFVLLQSELAELRAEILATKVILLSESPELQAKFDETLVNARTDKKIEELLRVASHFKGLLESLTRESNDGAGDGFVT